MLKRIEQGEATGIVSWHPDRLARNSVDGGQIVYFLDTGKLASMKFPSHWFENTPQGKFSLSMAFVQSKYYVDSLSENISNFLAKNGIVSRGGKRIHKTRATFILSNPFYTGLFNYAGELH